MEPSISKIHCNFVLGQKYYGLMQISVSGVLEPFLLRNSLMIASFVALKFVSEGTHNMFN